MAIYLNENEFGFDASTIAFPHILLCMGLLVLSKNGLFGMHLDTPQTTRDSVTELAKFIRDQGGTPTAVYGSCNRSVRYKDGTGGNQKWIAEMTEIAGLLGFHGTVSGFDTGIIAPVDGTYVEYVLDPARDRCKIFYKQNVEMVYQYGRPGSAQIFKFRPGFGVGPVNNPTIGATAATGPGLQEVDYDQRTIQFAA